MQSVEFCDVQAKLCFLSTDTASQMPTDKCSRPQTSSRELKIHTKWNLKYIFWLEERLVTWNDVPRPVFLSPFNLLFWLSGVILSVSCPWLKASAFCSGNQFGLCFCIQVVFFFEPDGLQAFWCPAPQPLRPGYHGDHLLFACGGTAWSSLTTVVEQKSGKQCCRGTLDGNTVPHLWKVEFIALFQALSFSASRKIIKPWNNWLRIFF